MEYFCWCLVGLIIFGIILSCIFWYKNKDLDKAERIVDLLNKINNDKSIDLLNKINNDELRNLLYQECNKIFSKNESKKN